ncbi:MAG: DUF1328 domain-containing protein [Thioalkalivibrio sp.]|nr:DUF1328 domain-containing protein [Thioalkalivibrio sp.]
MVAWREVEMLYVGVLGFGGIAGTASSIAQILFFIFLLVLAVALETGWRRRPPRV